MIFFRIYTPPVVTITKEASIKSQILSILPFLVLASKRNFLASLVFMNRFLPSQIAQPGQDYRQRLLSKAFQVVAGAEYNRVSSALRDKRQRSGPLFYEIILEEDQTWGYVKDRVYPSFIRYLKYKGMDPTSGRGLIISLFFKDRFYLIEAPEFVKAFCEVEGVDTVTFHGLVAKWLSETNL
jgi:hypothetical protein